MNTDTLNIADVVTFCRSVATVEAVAEVLMRQAVAEVTTERVNAYMTEAFDAYRADYPFYADAFSCDDGAEITNRDDLFLSGDDEGTAAWYAHADTVHKANGSELPEGYCPALCAKAALVTAENALLAHAAANLHPCFGKVHSLKLRSDALELLMKSPGVRA